MTNERCSMNEDADSSPIGRLCYTLRLVGVAALGGLLFGYDTAVISGAIGFLERHFSLGAAAKGWAVSSALVGCILGVMIAAALNDRLGRRQNMRLAAIFFLVSAVGTALAWDFTSFIVFRIIGGLGVGAASMTSPLYIAEISPRRMRGGLVAVNQLAIVVGILGVYFVNYAIAAGADEAWNAAIGWRWMLASGAAPALLFCLLLFVVPESPRWLTQAGRESQALDILTRIGGAVHARTELDEIRDALRQEEGTWGELLKPGLRAALLIGVVVAVFQQASGITVVCYYAPEIFKQMGAHTASALGQTVIMGVVNLLATVAAIVTVDRLGRKPLLLLGTLGMGLALLALGTAFYLQRPGLGALVSVLVFIASFACSVGPVTWVLLAEIFPTRVRGRAMGVATIALWIAAFAVSQTFPSLDNHPALVARFHHAFSFWLYGSFCVLSFLFMAFFVPETKGKSLEEIEYLWLRGPDLKNDSGRRDT